MKYVLIETEGVGMGVGIYPPSFFNTLEMAHEKMCRRIADIRGVSLTEVDEYHSGSKYIGWAEKHGRHHNFQIFEVPAETL